MPEKGLFNPGLGCLLPADKAARDLCDKLKPDGRPLFVTVRSPRNPEFSALAHVVFNKIADGIGVPLDAVKQWLKDKTGRYDLYSVRRKKTKVYHSVSFESMSEEQFRAFWKDSEPFIAQLIGGFDTNEGAKILAIMNGEDRNYRQ